MICAACTATIENDPASSDPCPRCGEATALVGRYRLLDVLGQGGQATTYRAARLADGEVFAIKEVMVRRLDSTKAFELFEREAAVLRTLRHHGIPSYVEDFTAGEGRSVGLYLVQEFVPGRTLEQLMREHRFTEAEVRALMIEVLDILQYLHRFSPPVVHRDVKPSNLIRRDGDDRLALIDFGAVRDMLRDREGGGSTVAGTFGYMAPEQFTGQALPTSDIYGLGATAVALLSRQDPAKLLDHNQRLGWRDVLQVSPHTRSLLERMLAPNPQQRANDAGALLRELLDPPALPPTLRPAHLPSALAALSSHAHGAVVAAGSRVAAPVPPRSPAETVVAVESAPRSMPLAVRNRYTPPHSRWNYLAGGVGGLGLVGAVPTVLAGGNPVGAIFLLALLLLGLRAVRNNLRARRDVSHALRDGEQTLGRVVECARRGRGYRLAFGYEVDGRSYRATSFHYDGRALPVGSMVTVLYLRDDPRTAQLLVPELRPALAMLPR